MKSPLGSEEAVSPDWWVAAAKSGSTEALDKLIDLLTKRFFAELGDRNPRGMSPANTISDLIQETVMRAREKFGVFEKDTFAEFHNWANGILRNKYRHWARNHRGRKSEAKQQAIWRAIQARRNLIDDTHLMRAEDDVLQRREEADRAYQIFERGLKPSDQYIIKLRLFENLRFKQIALLVNSTEDAVTKAYKRALTRLRKLAETNGEP